MADDEGQLGRVGWPGGPASQDSQVLNGPVEITGPSFSRRFLSSALRHSDIATASRSGVPFQAFRPAPADLSQLHVALTLSRIDFYTHEP